MKRPDLLIGNGMEPSGLGPRLAAARIVAVVTVDDPEHAAPLGRALVAGGIRVVELTLRTPLAIEALRAMRVAAPELLVGAGTVLAPRQAEAVQNAGAGFALAPGFDASTVRHCVALGLPFVPGVSTGSDIQAALTAGCRVLKFFPAEPLGGAHGLRIIAAPFAHLGVSYLPLGGIDEGNACSYFQLPEVVAVGGSWIAPRELIRHRAWDSIRQRAEHALALVSSPVCT